MLRRLLVLSAVSMALCLSLWIGPSRADQRVALVIGNNHYRHMTELYNPVTDARNMRDALKKLGFNVIFGEDLNKEEFERNMAHFAGIASNADVALIYYAGHGATFDDTPYAVPTDANLSALEAIPQELVPLESMIGELQHARGLRVAIIDACRGNEQERILKQILSPGGEVTHGLAPVKKTDGVIIAYASQYLTVAEDNSPGDDSPYTTALLHNISIPGIDVKDMFFRVAKEVVSSTNGKQRPELSISFYDNYALVSTREEKEKRPSDLKSITPADNSVQIQPKMVETTRIGASASSHYPVSDPIFTYAPDPENKPKKVATKRIDSSGQIITEGATNSSALNFLPQRAALLVAAPEEPSKAKTYVGNVVWSSVNAGNGSDQTPGTSVRADIDIPALKLRIAMIFQKNFDSSLAASHIAKLAFTIAQGSEIAKIKEIRVPQMRANDAQNGESLRGIFVPIAENYFLIGLSRGSAEEINLNLIKQRAWFDIPMTVEPNDRTAKLTFEKGSPGTEAIDELIDGRYPQAVH
jgi:Caspase domain